MKHYIHIVRLYTYDAHVIDNVNMKTEDGRYTENVLRYKI